MKRNIWTTAIICSLVAALSTGSLLARGGDGDRGKHNPGGGGAPKHGGGGPPKAGGGHHAPVGGGGNSRSAPANAPQKPRGGGAPHQPPVGAAPHKPNGGAPPQHHGDKNHGDKNPGHAHKPPIATPNVPGPGHQPGQPNGPKGGTPPVVTGGANIVNPPSIPKRGPDRVPGNVVVRPPGSPLNHHPADGPSHHRPPSGTPNGGNGIHVKPPGGNQHVHENGHRHHENGDHRGPNGHSHFVGNTVQIGKRPINLGNADYRPSYYQHGGHYHGHWNGNPGPAGYGLTAARHHHHNYRPYFWGLGGWGLGSLIYGSGYLGYANPYQTSYSGVGYNYAQPIPVVYNAPSVLVDPNVAPASSTGAILNFAIEAFKQNNFDGALDLVNRGISQQPDDAVLHEFRALVLFAKGDYQQAAATIHSVLAVGPGWDWPTMSGMYSDVALYTTQLRQLEATVKQNPMDAATRFLLAYHYLSDGYPDAAVRQLQQVVTLMPNDQVAASLLKMSTAPQANAASDPVALPTPEPPTDLPSPSTTVENSIDPSTVLGSWKAIREDGASFGLTLTSESKFSWSFQPKNQPPQTFSGTYSLEGNVIALEREGGGSLVGEITSNDDSKFNFKMVGAPGNDPGLNFTK